MLWGRTREWTERVRWPLWGTGLGCSERTVTGFTLDLSKSHPTQLSGLTVFLDPWTFWPD